MNTEMDKISVRHPLILPQPARNLTSCRPLFGTPCALFFMRAETARKGRYLRPSPCASPPRPMSPSYSPP
ncbi:hypothetical protein AtDm6_2099 [Acetobacter tropicalis]|uniref:Uncharacterized protein n=1 Tax=Acetobacter tropicalis TaxID=104102 RepID=A0A094YQH4_9PROT|nr:hypothetical protein AtDm6_2099 [Acetobacter tropicalis]